MVMIIYLDSSLFGEQSALVVDVVDKRFKAIVSLGDPSAREGICATDIRLQYFCHLYYFLMYDIDVTILYFGEG